MTGAAAGTCWRLEKRKIINASFAVVCKLAADDATRGSINSRIKYLFDGLLTGESHRDFFWAKKVRLFVQ